MAQGEIWTGSVYGNAAANVDERDHRGLQETSRMIGFTRSPLRDDNLPNGIHLSTAGEQSFRSYVSLLEGGEKPLGALIRDLRKSGMLHE